MTEPTTAAACDHTDHRVNDRGERQGQIARTAWESCATAATMPGCDQGFVAFASREAAQSVADGQRAIGCPESDVVEHNGHFHVELRGDTHE